MRYEVTWSIEVEAETPVSAAGQGWAIMEDAFRGGPASVVVVRDENGEHVATFDMEQADDPYEIKR